MFGVLALAYGVQASWYWPFGSEEYGSSQPRISELMEPASKLIDDASDLAGDGKIDESVETYRKALAELDRIERENPERAKSAEFATLRNKRAYVNAAVDSLLLSQVRQNARAIALSDTTELERKLAEEKWTGHMKNADKAMEKGDLSEMDAEWGSAFNCNTNASLRASVFNAKAAFHLRTGNFAGAKQSLAQAEARLHGCAVRDSFAAQMMTNSLSRIQGLLSDYGEIVAEVEAVCAGSVTSNSISRLADIQLRLERYDFASAAELRAAAATLLDAVAADQKPDAAAAKNFAVAASGFRKASAKVAEIQAMVHAERFVAFGEKRPDEECRPVAEKPAATPQPKAEKSAVRCPVNKVEQAMADIGAKDYAAAELVIKEMLEKNPKSLAALNLKAALEMGQENYDAAEATLLNAITVAPRSHFAYYNLATMLMRKGPGNKDAAKRYYESGRALGGPENKELEALLK